MPACHPARRFARIRASGTGNHRPVVYTTGLRMPMPARAERMRRNVSSNAESTSTPNTSDPASKPSSTTHW